MPTTQDNLLARITADPEVPFGKPCIRGHRITVQEVLGWLASGASQRTTSWLSIPTPRTLLDSARHRADEAALDESLSPKLVELLSDLFPESESALLNGLARAGDRAILDYAAANGFVLVTTDSDFESML